VILDHPATPLRTAAGIEVLRTVREVEPATDAEDLLERLDTHRGGVFTSTFEYPGRYRKGARMFVDPPLAVTAKGRMFRIESLNARGARLLQILGSTLSFPGPEVRAPDGTVIEGEVPASGHSFTEEERSRRPSVFSLVRSILAVLASPDPHLGLYGAFGYDLVTQFEDLQVSRERDPGQRDLVLYLPDRLLVVADNGAAQEVSYDFAWGSVRTAGLPRTGAEQPYVPDAAAVERSDPPATFRRTVELAIDAFRRGDLFEVVSSQMFTVPCPSRPSKVFRRLRTHNPAPYGALINLGEGEYLVSASPEMYLRSDGIGVETCPISGTVARGANAIEDEENIRRLLNSDKDRAELTMCTDVDRNDMSRVCVPGSVTVVGRRQVEAYSKVIHTVDHVRGRLLPSCDAIDAFLSHMWASTVTGAPKLWAMRFNERHERDPRRWYGGAFGWLTANGEIDTGITLRTVRVADGMAEVRAGCTLLVDSDADGEDAESRLKASAFLDAVRYADATDPRHDLAAGPAAPSGHVPLLLVDNEDSFVHTLANYLRQAGAEVVTLRAPLSGAHLRSVLREMGPCLVVLSPGPGMPSDFAMSHVIRTTLEQGCALFGVCLGLEGIAEYFGATLDILDYPMHGKESTIALGDSPLFEGLPRTIRAGRYHSVYVPRAAVPDSLRVVAAADGIVMAIEHVSLPVSAVQFHPESLLTARDDAGIRLIRNVVAHAAKALRLGQVDAHTESLR